MFQEPINRRMKSSYVEWLDKIIRKPRGLSPLDVSPHGFTTDGNYWNILGLFYGLKFFHCGHPIHTGQTEIHQDQVRAVGLCQFDAQFRVMCRQEHGIGAGRKDRLHQVRVGGIILHIKNR